MRRIVSDRRCKSSLKGIIWEEEREVLQQWHSLACQVYTWTENQKEHKTIKEKNSNAPLDSRSPFAADHWEEITGRMTWYLSKVIYPLSESAHTARWAHVQSVSLFQHSAFWKSPPRGRNKCAQNGRSQLHPNFTTAWINLPRLCPVFTCLHPRCICQHDFQEMDFVVNTLPAVTVVWKSHSPVSISVCSLHTSK